MIVLFKHMMITCEIDNLITLEGAVECYFGCNSGITGPAEPGRYI